MPNISVARLAELRKCEADLKRIHKRDAIAWVGPTLGTLIATNLANKAWNKWAPNEKAALLAVCGQATAALQLYTDSLPKE